MIVNDFLMAIFFLVIGSEIKKEILDGHLSDIKKASFPIIAAIGGVIVPAIIFMLINIKSKYFHGFGIPISTDIAFAVGVFMIFKNYLNPGLKVFLLSLAVVDDLLSIAVIGIFYSSKFNISALLVASIIFICLLNLKKLLKKESIIPYIVLGFLLWYFIYLSGVHATISGVLLAICLPFDKSGKSLVDKVEHALTPLCNYFILPLFAFSNTGLDLNIGINFAQTNPLILGIILGLVVGKPLGIMSFSYIATKIHLSEKPEGTSWMSIFYVSIIAGIGFTMSIFVAELAFIEDLLIISISKISILISALLSSLISFIFITILPKINARICLVKKNLQLKYM